MKRTVIGGIFMFTGALISSVILLAAAVYVPSITSWQGSKLWFAIFGAKSYQNEVIQSLFLGFPFVVGVILFILGLLALVIEYYKKD